MSASVSPVPNDGGDVRRPLRTRLVLLGVALSIVAMAEWVSFEGIGGGVHTHLQNYFRYGDAFFSACWLAGALTFAASRRSWRSLAAYVAVGAICEAVVAGGHHEPGYGYRLYAGGLFGIVAFGWSAVEAAIERTEAALLVCLETIIFPALLLAAILPLDLTTYLHPTSLDGRMLLLEDSLFGGQPAWVVGRFFEQHGVFRGFETLVYVYLPTASGLVYLLERRSGRKNDLQVAFITAGIIGIVLLQLAPVAGPMSFRPDYPDVVPAIADAVDDKMIAGMRWRNSIPSLHTTWSLLVYWHARPHGLRPRIFGALWVVATITAMLGLGEHFLTDVPITIPFAVAMRALFTTAAPPKIRKQTFAVGAIFYLGWLGLLRAPEAVLANEWLVRIYAAAGVAAALAAERRLYLSSLHAPPAPASAAPRRDLDARLVVGVLFVHGLLLAAALRAYRDQLDAAGVQRGVIAAALLGAVGGALAAKRIGPAAANLGFAASSVVASLGWADLPRYLDDFERVSWGESVVWLAADVMSAVFIGPAAFFAVAAIVSALPARKGLGIGAAVLGILAGVLVSTPRVVFAIVPASIALALLFSRRPSAERVRDN